jgi:hypothetical protein
MCISSPSNVQIGKPKFRRCRESALSIGTHMILSLSWRLHRGIGNLSLIPPRASATSLYSTTELLSS